MNNFSRNLGLWAIIGLFLIIVFNVFQSPKNRAPVDHISYSDFHRAADEGRIARVEIQDDDVTGQYADGRLFQTTVPQDPTFANDLSNKGVKVSAIKKKAASPSFFHIFLSWLPMLILIGVWVFFIRQMQSGNNRAMGFGKSRARLQEDRPKVTFDDVAGINEAQHELVEVVDFLRDPMKFQKLGGKIPRGLLLVGSPGTGKTLLARAIAGEADVPFFSISGSDFVEMFVGVGASRVRDMFAQAKKNHPCIIFIDEIDAVGRHRGAGLGGGNDEREQTLNQLLVEMDGFEANEGIIIIAATNRPDVLDPALLRPGRFDRQVMVPLPDIIGREEILKVHARKVPLADDVDLKVIARGTPGFSGADLENLVNEAALLAARRNRRTVSLKELEESKDKVMMGAERRSLAMSDEEKKVTAYHEAGHALVAHYSPASDPIHKATIIPRGHALGMVVRLPERDRISVQRRKLEADLRVAMGGRIAEALFFGEENVTTGASSDIKNATDIARKMVMEWGMSEKLGPLTYGEPSQEVFLGHQVTQHKNISESTAQVIDQEIKLIVETAYADAEKMIKKHKKDLELIAESLLKYETLSGEEIEDLLSGKGLDRPEIEEKPKRRRKTRTTDSKRNIKNAEDVKTKEDSPAPKPQPS